MSYYQIAIPSYKRAETLCKKTLAYLRKANVDETLVTIFVADEDEERAYRSSLGAVGFLGRLVVGRHTLRAQRQFMREFYDQEENVFYCDDDLDGLFQRIDEKHVELLTGLDAFVRQAFHAAKINGAKLWGIYPVCNAFFMKPQIRTKLCYIVGCCYGESNDRDGRYDLSLEDKEDFERSILHWHHDRSLIRFEWVAPKTRYYREPGGMQETRTIQRVRDSAKALVDSWPQYCQINTGKKSDKPEVKLVSSDRLGQ